MSQLSKKSFHESHIHNYYYFDNSYVLNESQFGSCHVTRFNALHHNGQKNSHPFTRKFLFTGARPFVTFLILPKVFVYILPGGCRQVHHPHNVCVYFITAE